MFVMLGLGYLFELNDQTMESVFFLLFIILISTYPWAFIEHERKHQNQIGVMLFTENEIEIVGQSQKFEWSEVVGLGTGEVKGENIFSWYGIQGPKYSAGQNAFLKFNPDSEIEKIHLKFETFKDQRIFKEILFDQYSRGNLQLTTVYNGLGLEYEEIQKLKKTTYNIL